MEMVVSASTGAMEALLPKLAKILTDEYNLHKGVKEGIEYLRKELESMQVALEKVSKVPPDQLDGLIQIWARDMGHLFYHIEDTIDSYMVRVDAAGESKSSKSCCISIQGMMPRYKARRNIATEIERIKKEVEEASERLKRFKVEDVVAPAPSVPLRHALYEDVAKLVGIDHSRKELIKLLSMEAEGVLEQKLKLVSIVGPGGMGKTTLANAVYQKLRGQFNCAAFVSVSRKPNMKSIFSSILRQVSQQKCENTESWDEKEFMDKIRHVLQDKRYFIIIDDIWNESEWQHIRCVLIENNCGSKIIMITRDNGVAELCCSSDNVGGSIYKIRPLSLVHSKKLFYYKVFRGDKCPPQFKDASQKIIKKCDGLPLAIIAIASLFANKQMQTEVQWDIIYKSVHIDMKDILSLSFDYLPFQLRTCLKYLSIFPEGHIIERDDLIWRWIAEDFVSEEPDKNLYEVGEYYFDELVNRSMIEPAHVDAHCRVQACRVHDVVLEFITSLPTDANSVTILNGQRHPSDTEIHRLSLQNSKDEHTIPLATMSLSHVRSLVVFSHAIDLKLPLSSFQVLRVLDLKYCSSRSIKGVGNLTQLRYLRPSHTYLNKLPKEIGKLLSLQTLDLKGANIIELPSTVVQLRQLVRLRVDTRMKLPDGLRNMKSIEELSEIDMSRYPNLMEEVGNLSELRVLEISLGKWDESYEEPLLRCLHNLEKLQTLCIFVAPDVSLDFMLDGSAPQHLQRFTSRIRQQTEHIFSISPSSVWEEFSPFCTLPRLINSKLSNLSELSIMVKILRREDLSTLGELHDLRSLYLHVTEAMKERLVITGFRVNGHAITFRRLVNFNFASRAEGLVFGHGAMDKLQRLSLSFGVTETKGVCDDFCLGLENLTSLMVVDIGIDCRCAKFWEVKAAEDAMRKATDLNPNHPTLDLSRHFEREMVWNGKEEISDWEKMKEEGEEEEKAKIAKIGQWGGVGGGYNDTEVTPSRLKSLIIGHGEVIYSLEFSYYDHNGQQHTAGPWGGHGPKGHGSDRHKINLGPSEFLTEVHGAIGPFDGAPAGVIKSLTFITDAGSYGPFGEVQGTPFQIPVRSNGSIVGFFGRSGWYVDAFGIYVNPKQETVNEEEEAEVSKIGPWGGNGGNAHDVKVAPHRLESVTICSGVIVDSLAFSYSDRNGQKHTAGPWGGPGGSVDMIQLGTSEFLTAVYGTTGPFVHASADVVTSLTLVTNARSYGPFGQAGGTPFHIPMWSNGTIVGFFGRAESYVNAIGVYAAPEQEAMEQEDCSREAGLTKLGPWGGNGRNAWEIDTNVEPHRLESMTITCGAVVNSLQFSYLDFHGTKHTVGPWGSPSGNAYTIQLEPLEFLQGVSGTVGPFGTLPNVITSLTFATNHGRGYGPFGQGGGALFNAPVERDGCIVGFFGRAGSCLEALGVYIRRY